MMMPTDWTARKEGGIEVAMNIEQLPLKVTADQGINWEKGK
jgi:hypothetical protein